MEIPSPTLYNVFMVAMIAVSLWAFIYQIMHPETACQSAKVESYVPGRPPPQVVQEICQAGAARGKEAK